VRGKGLPHKFTGNLMPAYFLYRNWQAHVLVFISTISAANANIIEASRVIMEMASEGQIPERIARLKNNQPTGLQRNMIIPCRAESCWLIVNLWGHVLKAFTVARPAETWHPTMSQRQGEGTI